MPAPTIYPLEMPGRAIAAEIKCWIGDIESALKYDEFRREIPGAPHYAREIIAGRWPIIRALHLLHEEALAAENNAANARAMWPTVWAVNYGIHAMQHAAEAGNITADLILWSIRARADFEKVAPALM